jgi:hypothetical protein
MSFAFVQGVPGTASADPHPRVHLPLSADLMSKVDTILAAGATVAKLRDLMLANPRQIDQIATYVKGKKRIRLAILDEAIRMASRPPPPCLPRDLSARGQCPDGTGTGVWNTVENPSTMSNTNL